MEKTFLKEAKKSQKSFSKLLTYIENQGPSALKHLELLKPKHTAFRVGVTGPPGSGKSSLINCLLKKLKSKKVGVVCIDPTSPFTKGALLGDRIRYKEHKNVFVRSIGTRGDIGGICALSYLFLRAFDMAEFDIVFVETVGVGQTEWEIMYAADKVGVVLTPESGDAIQAMKAGIMEVADFFVLNKTDRGGYEALKNELNAISKSKVFETSSISDEGTSEVVDHLLALNTQKNKRYSTERIKSEAKALLRMISSSELEKKVEDIETAEQLRDFLMKECS